MEKENQISKYLVRGYYPTIGIECHVQLKTKTKLFSSVSNEAIGAKPNTLVSHVCYGLPGALPVLNKEAVHLSAKAAFALGTVPQKFSKFDRKHYFYPDLPKGYQITQFDEPIIIGGQVEIVLDNGETKVINITRAHIEEDAGKSTHPKGVDYSLVDLNRAGTPLLEIVSEPEIHNSKEAKAYAKELWLRMKYAGVSDVNLYHGNMRFDVNVSVSKNPRILGTRSETKNLNSFKSVERSVDYEIKRQIDLLEKGEVIKQETRGWVDNLQKTVSQRSKEDANDYRYFPDPDIPPVILDDKYIESVRAEMSLQPSEFRKKLQVLGIDYLSTEALLESEIELEADFLSLIIDSQKDKAIKYANWILNIEIPLRRELMSNNQQLKVSSKKRADIFGGVLALSDSGKLSSNNAKALIQILFQTSVLPDLFEKIAQDNGLIQVSDTSELEKIVMKVIQDNPNAVKDIKAGQEKVIGFLVGQVMKESKGQANPGKVNEIIKNNLKG